MAEFCEHSNKLSDCMRNWKFLDKFCDSYLPKRIFVTVQLMEDVNVEEDRIQAYNVSNGF